MSILLDTTLFILGFVIVYFSVDYLLDELEEYLEEYNISPVVFGFLILGIDLEESMASIFGAIEGLPLLSVGNLIGNSIIAIAIAFAIPLLLIPFEPEPIPKFYYQIFSLASINLGLSLLFAEAVWIFGIIGLVIFGTGLYYSISYQFRYNNELERIEHEEEEENFLRKSIMIVISLAVVVVGSEILVRSAGNLIAETGLSESFFGLVIMAFITNVEEFWLMFRAVQKDQIELGISAQLGKIFWNISLIFGVSALIIGGYSVDIAMLVSGLLFMFIIAILVISLYHERLERLTAFVFLIILVIFITVNIGFLFI